MTNRLEQKLADEIIKGFNVSNSQYVHVRVDYISRETDKAFLVEIDEDEIWIPKSQIADVEDYTVGDRDITLSITSFIAREHGLEDS